MNILTCVDFSESMGKVVEKAEEIAEAVSAKLWLLHVAEPEPDFVGYEVGPQSVRDSLSKRFHKEHRQIQDIAEQMRQNGIDTTALLVQGSTVETILMKASKISADMIVVGTHGKGRVYRLLVGSVSEGILRKANCSILVVPTHNYE
ncbi:MAG: nucleotide-binding universal stress UspA family protein [Desulforhopalus sp.]|jgi:nucleotide-binding universal stress UspA family protein